MTLSIKYKENYIPTPEGLNLFGREWLPQENTIARVILIHGLGDHSGRYENFAQFLAQNGFSVAAIDLRGHGNSGGKRGVIGNFSDYTRDVKAFLGWLTIQRGSMKTFLFGHSMGGLVALDFMSRENPPFQGVAVSCPFFAPYEAVSFTKALSALVMNMIYPSYSFEREQKQTLLLSHDPKIAERYLIDPQSHLFISARLYASVIQTGKSLLGTPQNIACPFLMLLAGEDRMVKSELSEQYFRQLQCQDKTQKFYPTFYHEILNEIGKEEVYQDILEWLKKKS